MAKKHFTVTYVGLNKKYVSAEFDEKQSAIDFAHTVYFDSGYRNKSSLWDNKRNREIKWWREFGFDDEDFESE